LAPGESKTPFGEMLRYYLTMEPQLFQSAVNEQFQKLQEKKEEEDRKRDSPETASEALDLVLYRRMSEVKAKETREILEDLMYLCVLEKFVELKVPMLPRMDGVVDIEGANLKSLTEGIHSKEALEMVKDHVRTMMGPAATSSFSNTAMKMSKLQMTQVYAASVLFGYFLRRVDQRFQLERKFGTLDDSAAIDASTDSDTIARLERLFNAAESTTDEDEGASSSGQEQQQSGEREPVFRDAERKGSLKEYVEAFDQATLVETARILSIEAAALVERQTHALFGDVQELKKQMQSAVGDDAMSMEDVLQRVAAAVEQEKVETLTMTVGTQRRAILEAIAYGTFLRDIESHVDTEYHLLTPSGAGSPPPALEG